MRNQIEYRDGEPFRVSFRPDFITSEGYYDNRLGPVSMKYLCPKGWTWSNSMGILSRHISGNTPAPMIERWLNQAQDDVTETMDMLGEFSTLAKILRESEGA